MADAPTITPPVDGITVDAARNGRPSHSAVSFPELVWAHYLRQQEVHDHKNLHGPHEVEYRRRLAAFEAAEGELISAYWCTGTASAVGLTRKERRGIQARIRGESEDLRFHAATDWVAKDSPEIANVLHTCETLAVRVREVLWGSSERVAQQWILSIAGHLLGFADREDRRRDKKAEDKLVSRKRSELAKVEEYYHRAGEKLGRIVYFWGMMSGMVAVLLFGMAVVGLLWVFTDLDPTNRTTQYLATSYVMGGIGALVSVMTRMSSSRSSFNLDFEVGRRQVHRLGSFRPAIGAIFAVVLFFAMRADLFQVLPQQKESFYLYAFVGFLAGFSERWANVIFGRAELLLAGDEKKEAPPAEKPTTPKQPVPEERTASA
jgi:uncharacterized membrane protein YqjE